MSPDAIPELNEGEVYRAKASSWNQIYHTRVCTNVEHMDAPRVVDRAAAERHPDARECAECAGESKPGRRENNKGPRRITRLRMRLLEAALSPGEVVPTGELADRVGCTKHELLTAAGYLCDRGVVRKRTGGRENRWELAGADRGVVADD